MNFDYAYAYEDRNVIHTSRWCLSGIDTRASGNCENGRLWMMTSLAGTVATVELFSEMSCEAGGLVASGTADVSALDVASACCELSEANSSGVSGELWIESYLADCDYAVEVLVSLCVDNDLAIEYCNLDSLPAAVYSSSEGMSKYCAAASRNILLLVSQTCAQELGGYGAPEHRFHAVASRHVPDYRRLANPDQLKAAAVHWALSMAFGACHERAEETMFSQLRDHHDAKRKEAIDGWVITFNMCPDSDDDADSLGSSAMVSPIRL